MMLSIVFGWLIGGMMLLLFLPKILGVIFKWLGVKLVRIVT